MTFPFSKMRTITSLASLIGLGSALLAKVISADQHYIDFYPVYNYITMTGQMEVPNTYISSGIPYLWPGFQTTGNTGVLQPVLGTYMLSVMRLTYFTILTL